MKKNILKSIVVSVMTGLLASAVCVMPTLAEPAEQGVVQENKIKVTSENGLVSVELPNDTWKEIKDDAHNVVFSDGDCTITFDIYKADAKLPERVLASKDHKVAFENTVSNEEYVSIVSAIGMEEDDLETLADIVASFQIDEAKITDEILEHKVKDDKTIKDENYTAYVTAPEGLNVREDASTDSSRVAFMNFRDQFTVVGTVLKDGADTGWKKVNYNGAVGFANSAFMSTTRPDPLPDPKPQPQPQPQPQPETQPEYMGYQYSGKDPWGGTLSVTLRQVVDGNIEWTFTDTLDNGKMIYKEKSTPYTNGYTEWYIEGSFDDDSNMTYNYAGNFKLQGGGVEFTYTSGEIMEGDPENGQSASHQVGVLLDNGTNTVFLTK